MRKRRKGGDLATGFLTCPLPIALIAVREGRGHLGEDGKRGRKEGGALHWVQGFSPAPAPLLQVSAGCTWERTVRKRRKKGDLPLATGFLASPRPVAAIVVGVVGEGREHLGGDGKRGRKEGGSLTLGAGFLPAPFLQVRDGGTWERTSRERRKGGACHWLQGFLPAPSPLL